MIKQSVEKPCLSIEAGNHQITLIDVVRLRAEQQPTKFAYIFLDAEGNEEGRLTYAELDRRARKIGAALQALINPGERVLLLYPPGLDYIAAFFGCLFVGAIAVPAYPPKRKRNLSRLQSIIKDSQATVVLTANHLLGRMKLLSAEDSNLSKLRWLCPGELADADENEWLPPDISSDSLALLQYTSGSTSEPKGVMLSHRNLLCNVRLIQEAFEQDQESIIVSWLPLYHDMGLIGNIIQPLFVGSQCVLMSPMAFLQHPVLWLKAISRYRATTGGGPNFAYELCVRKVTQQQRAALDLSCWKVAFNGSEPISSETIDRFAAAFESCGFRREAFRPCYGLAEATLLVSCRPKSGPVIVKPIQAKALEKNLVVESHQSNNGHTSTEARTQVVSCGAVIDQEIAIIDTQTLTRCLPDQVGEVWVSGPSVAKGYWNRPDETRRTFAAYIAGSGEGPFLRTGDLGFLREGQLFIAGRLKDLIIIRGLNYYPHDIERTVEQCHAALRPGCGAAISILSDGEEKLAIVQEIDADPNIDLDAIIANIIESVAETHELQTHAVALIQPGSIPKTSSGKIQRFASRAAFIEGNLPVLAQWQAASALQGEINDPAFADFDPATEDTEEIAARLQSLVAAKLGTLPRKIDVNQIITRYGLDSLAAIELIQSIEQSLSISLPLTAFLENSSIADLATEIKRQLASADSGAKKRVFESPAEPVAAYPLSRGQRALWFIHQATPENTAYNIVSAARIISTLNIDALRKAFQALTDRHACLRTIFVSNDGLPAQRIIDGMPVSFHYEDAADWDEASLNNYLAEQSSIPFDFNNGPLMRIVAIKRSAQGHILLLTIHHIVSDFWSLAVLADELAALYQAEVAGHRAQLPPAQIGYAEFVRWQERMLTSDEGKLLESYWLEQLSGDLPMLSLPLDRARPPAQTYAGASQFFRLNPNISQRLRELSKACGATLHMTLLAVFQTLLHRYTNDTDIILGSPAAGRSNPGLARTIGYFVNMLVLRTGLDGNPSFENLLQRTRQTVLGAFRHQHYPFDLLIEKLQPERDPSFSPVFQVMFVFLKSQLPAEQSLASFALGDSETHITLGGLELKPIALPKRASQFDLTLIMAETDDSLLGNIEYNTDIFDSVTIKRLSTHLQNVIESILADPLQQISDLSMLTKAESYQLLVGWNDTAAAWSADFCLHEAVAAHLRKTPDATAVVFNGESLSCQELDLRTNQLARYLRRLGARPDAPVGVFVERSAELIISLLAVLKAGGAYLPLDPSYPQERLRWMLEDAGAKLLITQRDISDKMPLDDLNAICVDADWDEINKESQQSFDSGATSENLAYVIYTSGSSGRPKGVMISHRAIGNRLMWMQSTYRFADDDRVLQKTPMSFDASVWELFMPLIFGAKLVMASPGGHQSSDYLVRAIREEGITILQLVPTMLQVLLDEPEVEQCKSLRMFYSGGEALPVDVQKKYFERIGKRLINLYGPTETSIDATYWNCERTNHQKTIPIGWPISNNQVYLLDRFFNPVAIGLAGELYVGGNGLGRGYLNRPDLTAERFIPNPYAEKPGARLYRTGDLARRLADGRIEFLGRLDFQVKIKGFRIELGEIESRLAQHPLIRNAVVIAMNYKASDAGAKRAADDKRLVAYLTANDSQPPSITDLRKHIKEALPDYMVPSAFVFLESLPQTSNGKLDRRALPIPGEARPELAESFTAARNPSEKILADIWARALGLEKVGIRDNFFDLGGDSILSIQIVAKARQAGLIFNAKDLFQYQTIAELANIAGNGQATQAEQGTICGPVPLTPIQRWFFEQNFLNAHHWNQFVLVVSSEPLDTLLLNQALEYVIGHHDVLRSQFKESANGWQQLITETDKNFALAAADLTEVVERQRTPQIERWTDRAQATLSLSDGALVRAAHFKNGEQADKLFISIHHLVTDAVSWRIILEDLNTAYNQLKARRQIELPPKTTSFKQWGEKINQYAESGELDEELHYWLRPEAHVTQALPIDYAQASNTVASARAVSIALNKEETQTLLQETLPAYRTRIDELLLAALLLHYEEWSGKRVLFLDAEGHGREEIVSGVDLTRTVGWFTSIYPLVLRAIDRMTPGTALKLVKEQVRSVPRKGIGYGLLRYCGRAEVREKMQALPPAQISFNFLGDLDQALRESGLFSMTRRALGLSASPSANRAYLIEIEGSIIDGCLQIKWTYSSDAFQRSTMERAIGLLLKAIRQLIEESCSVGAEGLVPSDFKLAKLDQSKLDKLSALLNKKR